MEKIPDLHKMMVLVMMMLLLVIVTLRVKMMMETLIVADEDHGAEKATVNFQELALRESECPKKNSSRH